jgi:site-specific recombinase XerC
MPRATPVRTRYPGVLKRTIYARPGGKGQTVYDIKIRNQWVSRGKFTNLEAARQEREHLVVQAQGGRALPRTRTLRDFMEKEWLVRQEARVAQGKLRSSTLDGYRRDVKNHIVPALGDKRLADVSVADAQGLADALLARGLAAYTVLNILKPASSAYALARKQRLVQFNPFEDVEKPEAKAERQPIVLTLAQVMKLADAAPSIDDRNFILLGALAGVRISENLALKWSAADLSTGAEYLRVSEQFYKGKSVPVTKTPSGMRIVPLSAPQRRPCGRNSWRARAPILAA